MADEDNPSAFGGDDEEGIGGSPESAAPKSWRSWLAGRTGWLVIIIIAILQGLFAIIMMLLKGSEKPLGGAGQTPIQALAVEMLGREVSVKDINQLISGPSGRRMTIGLDIVLVLGQLPEERIEGAPRPNEQEFEAFTTAIADMEPRIRSRMNTLLQKIPYEEYASPDVYTRIKTDIQNYVNDELEGLAFGNVRPEIGKRRVTDVLLPLFVRQSFR